MSEAPFGHGPDGTPPDERQTTLIHNEQTKLAATFINGIAIAIFAIGGFAPFIAAFSSTASGPTVATGVTSVICLLTSGALHLTARRLLRGLRE